MNLSKAIELASKLDSPNVICTKKQKFYVIYKCNKFFKYPYNGDITNEKSISVLRKSDNWNVYNISGLNQNQLNFDNIPKIKFDEVKV